jgi:predicted pyridoxine 5'-phosphate oxidase superfamily flavin-nucleotide-binding protein
MQKVQSNPSFSPSVLQQQEARGSRKHYARVEGNQGWRAEIDEELASFIAARDHFYLSSVSAGGQPYIQHRGGPKGFLKVLGPTTLGIADFGGNRQYVSLGNIADNPKVMIFLMDYANRRRVKIWAEARVIEDDPDLIARLSDPDYKAKVERAILFDLTMWEVNCHQHITPRHDEEMLQMVNQKLIQRVAELEQEMAALKAGN